MRAELTRTPADLPGEVGPKHRVSRATPVSTEPGLLGGRWCLGATQTASEYLPEVLVNRRVVIDYQNAPAVVVNVAVRTRTILVDGESLTKCIALTL
jgi:hypothetical protein